MRRAVKAERKAQLRYARSLRHYDPAERWYGDDGYYDDDRYLSGYDRRQQILGLVGGLIGSRFGGDLGSGLFSNIIAQTFDAGYQDRQFADDDGTGYGLDSGPYSFGYEDAIDGSGNELFGSVDDADLIGLLLGNVLGNS